MKQKEKRFICDLVCMLLAAGILCCLALLAWEQKDYLHMLPLIFILGVLLLGSLAFRAWILGCRKRMIIFVLLAIVSAGFAVSSVLFSGR